MNTKIKGRNIIGERFGTLTVIEKDIDLPISKQVKFHCKCDCGTVTSILRHSLITGNTKKCKHHPLNEYIEHDDYILLDISTPKYPNTFTKIDKINLDKVLSRTNSKGKARWMVYDSSYGRWGKYVTDTNRSTKLHRFVMDLNDPELIVDHLNGDTLDNRINNLKVITRSENNKNMRKHINNSSGYTGVSFKEGLWSATIQLNNNKFYLGGFDTKEEANIAYRAAAKVLGFSERHGN